MELHHGIYDATVRSLEGMKKGGNREIIGGDLLAFHFAFVYTIAFLQRVSKFCAKDLIYN